MRVEVTGGVVEGAMRRGLRMWRGIPYAAPPIDDLRFRAPAPVVPWTRIRSAAAFGPVAPQDRNGQFAGPPTHVPMSEDCLTINVIAPPSTQQAPRPVMVFIHGGAYSVGSAREIHGQGEGLVREGGVVFVNMNYRLGALGYLDFSAWSTPERRLDNNLGLRDQLAALEWVRDNIAAFGGDPECVTVFGESAGANAVTTLMAVPRAAGLFQRAIAQSAPANAVYPAEVAAEWARDYLELLSEAVDDSDTESTSVEDAASLLMTAPVDAIVAATTRMQRSVPDSRPGTMPLAPVIDGDLVTERPLDVFRAGRQHPVPLIIGTNDREGSLFRGRLDILASNPRRIRAIFSRTKKKARKALKAQYPGLPARRPAADFGGDFAFWYPSVKLAERHSSIGATFMYRFDATTRLLKLTGHDATHGLELFALFERMNGAFGRVLGALGGRRGFIRAGERMREHWIAFARTGRPLESWPRYTKRRRRTLIIGERDRVEEDPRHDKRIAWQAFVPHV
ncbi:para-nitrobenzyl esterase [Microbacteriaceae bacterium SG_E_30_P1]|uniref:Carboxylic ester hydrolase n=1 Tax=Antiquaquibacter oligotrophicus TaxID=2880260 RepID=A0ABT6KLZ7_9MICO|nr:carboxylesterase/lipase family protein [Antiquaquibacter oligotrophicus]MDH6181042.1 para-nitrobenzyl esterase [Antiquaquibacter oligotrophicus]UDF13260.1 carboxylesterase/lipase family protein [Antiquaquibacter oligotrophicus]